MKLVRNPIRHQVLILFVSALTLGTTVACAQSKPMSAGLGSVRASAQPEPAKTTLLQPMQQMITKLKKLQATGDPDFDYAFQAKVHNQGVQDLLKQEIQNGKNDSLKQMAQSMLTAAQTDQATIDATLKQLKPSRPNQAFTQQQNRNIEAMNLKLQQTGSSDKLTNDIDKNFKVLLLDQRQDAIDLAATYLQYGRNNTLRTYAEQMTAKAKQEMEKIKAMP